MTDLTPEQRARALELYRLRGDRGFLHSAIRMLRALVAEATWLVQLEEQQVDPAALADNAAVDVLAAAMKAELEVKRLQGRGGWGTSGSSSLLGCAVRHAEAVMSLVAASPSWASMTSPVEVFHRIWPE